MKPHVSAHRCGQQLYNNSLGGGSHNPHIDVSDVVLCYCTEKWFTNTPCLREVVRAVLCNKPLIALLEPDTSDVHGGLTEVECRAILRGQKILDGPGGLLSFADRLQGMSSQVSEWSEAWDQQAFRLPTADEIESALFESAPLVWSPLTDLQD
eukprot:1218299-Prymnesium_polylepis.1